VVRISNRLVTDGAEGPDRHHVTRGQWRLLHFLTDSRSGADRGQDWRRHVPRVSFEEMTKVARRAPAEPDGSQRPKVAAIVEIVSAGESLI